MTQDTIGRTSTDRVAAAPDASLAPGLSALVAAEVARQVGALRTDLEQAIASLEELMQLARELGVKLTACTMSMDAMGVQKDELIDGLEYGGVATFLADASRSRVCLFI